MGVILVWADEMGELLADYRFVGSEELSTFDSSETIARFMGTEGGPLWCELSPALAQESLLEDLSLISLGVSPGDRSPYHSNLFSLPPATEYKVAHLSLLEWYRMPVYLIVDHFKNIFGRDPDITDLRLFRIALYTGLQVNSKERVAEARRWILLGNLAEYLKPE